MDGRASLVTDACWASMFGSTRHCIYLVFAQVYIGWSGEQLIEELAERPYVLVGFLAWLILVPLGITSAHTIRKKMGRALAPASQTDLRRRHLGVATFTVVFEIGYR